MTSATRVERILIEGRFGEAVLVGMAEDKDARAAVRVARQIWGDLRQSVGYKSATDLLTPGENQVKLGKSAAPSYGFMLIPARGLMAEIYREVREAFDLTGGFNLCPMASLGCAAACLSRSGQSGMDSQQRAQAVRTAFLLSHPHSAGLLIGDEIRRALRKHGEINLRLNTTSDIRYELVAHGLFDKLSAAGVNLYDYTAWSPADRKESSAYSLTYSAKEPAHTSDEYLVGILSDGGNVAMPFTTGRGKALPATWQGFTVIDGDKSDDRTLDPRGVVVGLRAKGHEWKKDNTAGFIRQAN